MFISQKLKDVKYNLSNVSIWHNILTAQLLD